MTSASTFSESSGLNEPPEPRDQERPAGNSEGGHGAGAGQQVQEQRPSSTVQLHGLEPSGDQLRLFVSQTALQELEKHCSSNLTVELGGVLLGQAEQDSRKSLVKVMAVLPVATDDHGPVHFTFTADTWAQLHKDKAVHHDDLEIVGWYHTHPNLGAFYSTDDVIVHTAAFVMPWQIGLVVDPVRGEGCLVGWQAGEAGGSEINLAGIDGFYELLDAQPGSALSWRLIPSDIWQQDGYYPTQRQWRASQVYAPDTDWLALPPISPWWGVLLGGMSLLISLLLIIERLFGS